MLESTALIPTTLNEPQLDLRLLMINRLLTRIPLPGANGLRGLDHAALYCWTLNRGFTAFTLPGLPDGYP